MDTNINIVGKNIRFFRKFQNWTISQLALKTGTTDLFFVTIEKKLYLPFTNCSINPAGKVRPHLRTTLLRLHESKRERTFY